MALTSCKKGDGSPEGMQLVRGGDELGYYFYAPEEWTVANRGGIAAAYASKVSSDRTSVTFVKSEAPEGTVEEYFNSYKDAYPAPITVTSPVAKAKLGNASSAYSVSFEYTSSDTLIKSMQIFAFRGEDFYIFTYTSFGNERAEGESYYDFYLKEKIVKVIDSFKFVDKNGEVTEPKEEYEVDADGYKLISDKRLCGFELYVPADYEVNFSSGMVVAFDGDGRSINAAEPSYAASNFDEYWENRKKSLSDIVDNLSFNEEDIKVPVEHPEARGAASYEYSYKMNGVKYRVYQVIMVSLTRSYVFTYTAEDSLYEDGLADAKKALMKFRF